MMSLEVFEKCDDKSVYLEWERLINLEVDGICTKYPEKLISPRPIFSKVMFKNSNKEAFSI